MTARQRITRSMWFGVDYSFTDRADDYVGYNDYTRDHFVIEYSWSPGARFDLDVEGYYRIYDFPDAFAYNNPARGTKTLETASARAALSYRLTPRLSILAEAEYNGATSTDLRIGYDRNWYSIGVVWRQ